MEVLPLTDTNASVNEQVRSTLYAFTIVLLAFIIFYFTF